MLLQVINFDEKRITVSQEGRNFGDARAIYHLHSFYNLALV